MHASLTKRLFSAEINTRRSCHRFFYLHTLPRYFVSFYGNVTVSVAVGELSAPTVWYGATNQLLVTINAVPKPTYVSLVMLGCIGWGS